ncbi:cysteinyl-tRNA synthetase [Rachicladosporium monterosium]|uniref:Cysteinyl-tRNA synthetase n=1 Tax=Rachicladosporium monterosium TaxID=1507873 RepID=A0ABR0LAQ3_9PEZI|nr:cysteinyl-tRNA synthetase [Rachicladosporium monterosium]
MATAQPRWQPPPEPSESVRARLPQLSVYNSLTRSKTPFVPLDAEGRKVGWYACGPTVYDDSVCRHARNYVSTDIIRRILSDYFKFHVTFVMNITDVDDKIILAARQQHLLSQWLAKHASVDSEVRDATAKAFRAYVEKNLPLVGGETTPEAWSQRANEAYGHVLKGQSAANDGSPPGDAEAKIKMHLRTAGSAAEVLSLASPSMPVFVAKASGVLLPYIDGLEKHTIDSKDHDVFTKFTKRYEQRFFDDMAALNVRSPDQVTRVTEYGPQIVDFVKQIEQNGFAYENEGSVYYDTQSWESTGGVYARLEPWNRNDKELQQDGEGSLSTKKTGFKRSEMIVVFGLDADYKPSQLGWSGLDIPDKAKPFVIPLSQMRDRVREQAKSGAVDITTLGKFDDKDTIYASNQPYANAYADFQRKLVQLADQHAPAKDFLAACDYVRDKELWDLAIYLEDRDGLPALIRPLSQSHRDERSSRDAATASKTAAKEQAKADAEAADKRKLEQGKVSPLEIFRTSEYSAWDAEGLPTHDAEGKEVAKSRGKKLRKEWERQRKLHESWVAAAAGQRADSGS